MHKPFNALGQLAPSCSYLATFYFLPAGLGAVERWQHSRAGESNPGHRTSRPVLISLESRGTVINTVYTDGEGRFGFNGLPGNIYHIKIDDEAYFPASETLIIDPDTTSVRMVNIFLNPRDPAKPDSRVVTGGNPHLTSSANLKKLFPRPAIKEFDRRSQSGQPPQAG